MLTIRIISRDLTQNYLITSMISFSCKQSYNSYGTFTLELKSDFKNDLLVNGNYIVAGDFHGTIERVGITNEKITVNGYSLNWLLNTRVALWKGEQDTSTIENAIYSFYEKNRRDLGIETAPVKGIELTTDIAFDMGDKLGEVISASLEKVGLGHRVYIDFTSKKLIFEIYQGADLTDNNNASTVMFSIERGNMKDVDGSIDTTNVVNGVFVFGEYIAGNTLIVQVSASNSNLPVREAYISADKQRDEQTNSETNEVIPAETDEEFRQRLIKEGENYISENATAESFNFTVLGLEYGERYTLGDLVYCRLNQFGLEFKTRIVEYEYMLSRTGESKNITLGLEKRRRFR